MFKIGSQLFTAEGPRTVEKLGRLGPGIFLDLKFHDIPNTVAGAVAAATQLPGVELINIHALGGLAMMKAAVAGAGAQRKTHRGNGQGRPRLIAVTILTSLDSASLRRVGIPGTPRRRSVELARLAKRAGLDGVVAPAHAVKAIRHSCGKDFLIVVPGVRPAAPGTLGHQDDQAQVATPAAAICAGADYIVVGRPITAAPDPRAAAEAVVQEIALALRTSI